MPLSPEQHTILVSGATGQQGGAVARHLMDRGFRVRALEIAGDELSMTETADAFARALGRDVEHVQVPWEAFQEQAGEEATRMYRWFEEEGYRADIEALGEMYPALTDFGSFLRRQEWIREARRADGDPDRVRRLRGAAPALREHVDPEGEAR